MNGAEIPMIVVPSPTQPCNLFVPLTNEKLEDSHWMDCNSIKIDILGAIPWRRFVFQRFRARRNAR